MWLQGRLKSERELFIRGLQCAWVCTCIMFSCAKCDRAKLVCTDYRSDTAQQVIVFSLWLAAVSVRHLSGRWIIRHYSDAYRRRNPFSLYRVSLQQVIICFCFSLFSPKLSLVTLKDVGSLSACYLISNVWLLWCYTYSHVVTGRSSTCINAWVCSVFIFYFFKFYVHSFHAS